MELSVNLFWSVLKALSNLLIAWILPQGSKVANLVDEYKIIFLRKWDKHLNFPKRFLFILELNITWFEVCQNLNWVYWGIEYVCKAHIINFDGRRQNHFSGKRRQNLKRFKKFLLILDLPINLFWSLAKIFWLIEYYCKTEKAQILSTIKKTFLSEIDANYQTFQSIFPNIEVIYL